MSGERRWSWAALLPALVPVAWWAVHQPKKTLTG